MVKTGLEQAKSAGQVVLDIRILRVVCSNESASVERLLLAT